MMQELTYAFPILSWLLFLSVIIALVIWVKDDRQVIGRFIQGEAFPSRLPS